MSLSGRRETALDSNKYPEELDVFYGVVGRGNVGKQPKYLYTALPGLHTNIAVHF